MKSIINMYYEYLKDAIILDPIIGPVEKSKLLDKIIFIINLYNDGFISGRECLHMLTKN